MNGPAVGAMTLATRRLLPLLALAVVPACSPRETGDPAASSSASAIPTPAPAMQASDDGAASPARVARYSALEGCKLVREERVELPYTETLCSGPAGWAVRIADADARQTLAVIPPAGRETRLDTARIGGGGFSSFGKTAEWRGPAGSPFAPDALIVRYQVAEQPHPAPETAYLLAIRLAPEPCIVARVRPGPEQNGQARIAADSGRACLAD